MEVRLTPDQEAFIRDALAAGRLNREEDAVEQAMLLWEERERRRMEILAQVDAAEVSLSRGEGRKISSPEDAKRLVEDVKRRGMARLAPEQNPRAVTQPH